MDFDRSNIQPRLLDVKRAAVYLSSSPKQIRKLIWLKRVRVLKFGRKYLIDRRDLDTYIDRLKAAA